MSNPYKETLIAELKSNNSTHAASRAVGGDDSFIKDVDKVRTGQLSDRVQCRQFMRYSMRGLFTVIAVLVLFLQIKHDEDTKTD